MLKKNDELTLTIEKFGGEMGIAHLDGMTLFVQGALPGETVEARAQKVEKNVAFLKTLRVLNPSPDRTAPKCPFYEKCGGCVCQHMRYSASLEMKREKVRDALQRLGGLTIDVPPVIGMEDPWHYRNKIAMPVGGEKGGVQIGYFAPRSHRIVDVTSCAIARRESDQVLSAVRLWMEKFQVEPYHEASRSGLIRHIMSRVSRGGEVMAVLVATRETLPHGRELLAMLRSAVPGLASFYINVNKRGDNVILGPENHLVFGKARLEDTLCGLTFSLSPLSFFQVNPDQTEKLYQTAVDFAMLTGRETVVDLYCGAGTISLLLARQAKEVIGIEVVPQAIWDAIDNARANGVTNVQFHAAAAEKLLPALVQKGLRPDVVVLDPPRKGCETAVLEAIAQAAPRRVVYVSCDPATLARDARLLCARGYRAEKCQSVDMFCQTGHVETVLLMSQQKPDDTIHVGIDLKPEDVTVAESKATYAELQAYIEEKYGFKVSNLYIAQAKAALGIKERENYNKPKDPNSKKLVCPPDKMAAIQEALRHFKMI